jgi:hypothetical protein
LGDVSLTTDLDMSVGEGVAPAPAPAPATGSEVGLRNPSEEKVTVV